MACFFLSLFLFFVLHVYSVVLGFLNHIATMVGAHSVMWGDGINVFISGVVIL